MDALLKINLKGFCDIVMDVYLKKIKKEGEIVFTVITYKNNDSTTHPIFCKKGSPMDYAQKVIDKENPEMYCIVSEAWMRVMPKKESKKYEKNYKWGDMKKDPEKVECVFFLGKTMDGSENYNRIFTINHKNPEVSFEEIKDDDGTSPNLKSTKLK